MPRWASFEWEKGSSRESPTTFIGLYSYGSMAIIPYIVPSVLLGIPLGSYLIRLMDPETFRRICMAFDALIVTFGLSRVLIELNLATAIHHLQHPHDRDDAQCLLTISIFPGQDRSLTEPGIST